MTKIDLSGNKLLLLLVLLVDYVWIKSSWGKLSTGNFPAGMGETLSKFAAKNPYPFMQGFLEGSKANSVMLGNLVMWGEALVAVSLLISTLTLFTKTSKNMVLLLISGLLGGMWLNLVFYFAAGWTSSSTESLNLLMFGVQLILLCYAFRLLKR